MSRIKLFLVLWGTLTGVFFVLAGIVRGFMWMEKAIGSSPTYIIFFVLGIGIFSLVIALGSGKDPHDL